MAKSNAQKCKDYRKKAKAKGRKLSLPLPEGTDKALAELMAWHSHTDDREAICTFIHQLHAMGREGSAAALGELKRKPYEPDEQIIQRLVVEGSRVTGDAEAEWR